MIAFFFFSKNNLSSGLQKATFMMVEIIDKYHFDVIILLPPTQNYEVN